MIVIIIRKNFLVEKKLDNTQSISNIWYITLFELGFC